MNLDLLVRRAEIVRGMRAYFDAQGFLEVETPVRLAAPAPECHIDCPPVATGGFLRASPELQMKKLLAVGLDRIYQIGPCFRDGERGARHNPEFTMVEWYRRDADYRAIADDLAGLLGALGAAPAGA
ncbi:MAG: EF-P lysine aminoacylase GenX, partial [Kiritimatiellae bacterium]|nr:EF-P lysine aminoacylase GenX [Kiritimatiellia bacterium]